LAKGYQEEVVEEGNPSDLNGHLADHVIGIEASVQAGMVGSLPQVHKDIMEFLCIGIPLFLKLH